MQFDLAFTIIVNVLVFAFTTRLFWRLFSRSAVAAAPPPAPATPMAAALPEPPTLLVKFISRHIKILRVQAVEPSAIPLANQPGIRVPVAAKCILTLIAKEEVAPYEKNRYYLATHPLFVGMGIPCPCDELILINEDEEEEDDELD